MKRQTSRSRKERAKKGLVGLLTVSMCLSTLQGISFADSRTEVGGVEVNGRKITLSLSGTALRTAAETAFADAALYDDQYIGVSKDERTQAAYEALTDGSNPLYELTLFSDGEIAALEQAGVEVKALIQMDQEQAEANGNLEIATESDITKQDKEDTQVVFSDPDKENEKELVLYRPGSLFGNFYDQFSNKLMHNADETEITPADPTTYELNGEEKVTFLFINHADESRVFNIDLNGKTLEKGIKVLKAESVIKGVMGTLDITGIPETTTETKAEESTEAAPTEADANATVPESIDPAAGTTDVTDADNQSSDTTDENAGTSDSTDAGAAETTAPQTDETAEPQETLPQEGPQEAVTESAGESTSLTEAVQETLQQVMETIADATETLGSSIQETVEAVEETLGVIKSEASENSIASDSDIEAPETEAEAEKAEAEENAEVSTTETTTETETVKTDMDLELENERKDLLRDTHAADLVDDSVASAKVLQYTLDDLVDLYEKQKLELIYQGPDYTIHVYYTKEAEIPEDAELMVREIEEGTEEYGQYYEETLRQLGLMPSLEPIEGETEAVSWNPAVDKTQFVPFARYFDVKIMSGDTEIQPAVPVKIQVTYDTPVELPEDAEQKAVHFAASGTEVLEAQSERIESSDKASANASDPADTAAAENFAFMQSSFSVTSTIITNVPKQEEGTAEFSMLRSAAENTTKPTTVKTVTPEDNGLYKIRLDLTGHKNTTTDVTRANVIIVFDRSGSMDEDADGQTRLAAAKKAINDVAKSLLSLNTPEHSDLVELALISFSYKASIDIAKTTSYKDFSRAVKNITANDGTNWEDALQKVSEVTFDDDRDATYVIFVSDGNPTFRNTKGDYGYWDDWGAWHWNIDYDWYYQYWYNVYGTGYEDKYVIRNYDHAKDDARALVLSKRHFYTIGVFGNVDRMQALTNYAYSGSDDDTSAGNEYYYPASNAAALSSALSKIAKAITSSLGLSNVSVQDGVTQYSRISANANVPKGAISDFTYYKDDKIWTNAPKATFADNTVNWDLSSIGVMEDGVTYSVEFHVWPSQEAYDLVADLNNGAELSEPQKEEIQQQKDGSYGLKTNTSLKTRYTYNDKDKEDEPTYSMGVMPLVSYPLILTKKWTNTLDDREAKNVKLKILRDGNDNDYFITQDLSPKPIGESDKRSWQSDSVTIYTAPGVMIKKGDQWIVMESGHDYTVQESGDDAYHWELKADTYHPMLMNGKLTLLKLDPNGEYSIKDQKYSIVTESDSELVENIRRSNLNLVKKVVTAVDNADAAETSGVTTQDISKSTELNGQKFSYSITVHDAGNADIWFSVEDLADKNKLITDLITNTNAKAEEKDGKATGYYHIANGKELKVKLEANWNLRFINLPSGSSYSIKEVDIPEGYSFVSLKDGSQEVKDFATSLVAFFAAASLV